MASDENGLKVEVEMASNYGKEKTFKRDQFEVWEEKEEGFESEEFIAFFVWFRICFEGFNGQL